MALLGGSVSGLITRFGGTGSIPSRVEGPRRRRRRLERELEEARRLGHWFTEEDRQLLREHEARLAADRRGELVRRAGRGGAVALLLLACVQPLLFPLAVMGGVKAFPRTSRRIGFALLGLAGVGLIGATVALVQVGRSLLAPPEGLVPVLAPAAAPRGGLIPPPPPWAVTSPNASAAPAITGPLRAPVPTGPAPIARAFTGAGTARA